MSYQTVIGLEVHLELSTKTKMFCRCPADHFGKKPNTQTCPVCLGLPGALPYPNEEAVKRTILLGLALGCRIPQKAKFDRKNYFYPDLPKGYQISQYDQPFAVNGKVKIPVFGKDKIIRVNRVHLEEDAGKLIHRKIDGKKTTCIDFNRAGVPLVEIVSEPDISSPEEAESYARKLQNLARWLEISSADMEKGQLRLELNISLRKSGEKKVPAYRVEVKNINSFRFLKAAVKEEIRRQSQLLDAGTKPEQETRGFDPETGKTFLQRTKEDAHDYRYFPEPDIPPFTWTKAKISTLRRRLPKLPETIEAKLNQSGIRADEVAIFMRRRVWAEQILQAVRLCEKHHLSMAKVASAYLNTKPKPKKIDSFVTQLAAKKNQKLIKYPQLEKVVKDVLDGAPDEIRRYRAGKKELVNFFVGQVMGKTNGEADPASVRKIVTTLLRSSS